MAGITEYNETTTDKICELLSTTSRGLASICKEIGISTVTVYKWLDQNPEFVNKYARAREAQADFLADEILAIADDSTNDTETRFGASGESYEVENKEWTARVKLRLEARKWIASKLKPKKYGDKIDLTTDGEKINQTIIKWGDKEIQV